MVLYQIITTYHLLNAVIHKIKVNDDKQCVLMISSWITQKFPNYVKLNEIFDKVIIFEAGVVFKEPEYPQEITKECENLLKQNNLNLEEFEELNIWGSQFKFGLYLVHENIAFNYWEEGSGMLSKKDLLKSIESSLYNSKAEYCDNIGVYDGTAPCIKKKICKFDAQSSNFDFTNAENFDVTAEYLNLSKENQQKVKSLFTHIDSISIEKGAVLLLTQHFANLKILSFENHILIYQMLMDYFFEKETVVFKPHPDDFMYYGMLFPNVKIIRERFPSELLPGMFTNKPKCIATISSTAIDNLKSYFDDNFVLGNRFDTEFTSMHKYNVILKIKEQFMQNAKIEEIGTLSQVIKYLGRSEMIEANDTKFYFIDKLEYQEKYDKKAIIDLLENLDNKSLVAFVNSNNDFCFYHLFHKNIWNNLVPIVISKTRIKDEEFYENENNEVVYFFTKNKELKEKIIDFSYSKKLQNVGVKINVHPLSLEKRKIVLLKTLLKATENELMDFVQGNQTSLKREDNDIIENIRYSNSKLKIENIDDFENEMRILEGIIESTENRLLFYANKK